MKFLKPSFLTVKSFEEKDDDWTIAELTREEFINLKTNLEQDKKTITDFENKNKTLNLRVTELENYLKNMEESVASSQSIQENFSKLSEDFEKISEDLKKVTEDNEILKKQNGNLMRINKEKLNAKRGLKPKKTHHGYLKKSSEQYPYKILIPSANVYNKQKTTATIHAWKNKIQTPYFLDTPVKELKELISKDLKNLNIELVDLKKLGSWDNICKYLDDNFNISLIFEMKLKENIKEELWEFEVLSYGQLNL